MNRSNVRTDRRPLIVGIVLIVVGSVLFLEKLGYLPHGFVLHFWPMVFVIAGLAKLACDSGRVMGVVLIAIGVLLQLQQVGLLHLEIWQLWPLVLIIAGAAMLWQAVGRELGPVVPNPQFDSVYIFGGGERQINSKQFKGGNLFAMFGGYKIDLRHAEMETDQAVIEANAVFGGGEIIVPEHWLVTVTGAGVFGAYEDKTRHFQPDASKPTKNLIVKGVAVFGGIEIKN